MILERVVCRECKIETWLGRECLRCGYFNRWPVMK